MQKKVIPLLFVYLVTCCLAGYPQNPGDTAVLVTLKQCVDLAIKNNLLVEQSSIGMQTSKVQYNQALGNMLPQIYGQASQQQGFGRILNTYTYTYLNQQLNSGSYSANANLTLFSGLSLLNTFKQNNYAYSASKLDLQQQKESITLSVILGYLQVLSSRDLLAISREQADVDLKQVNRLQLQSDAGALLLLSNLSDLKGQYAGDLVNISTAVDNLETAKVNLYQLMNVPYNKNIQLEDILLDLQASDTTTSSEAIYQTALQTLPEIKSADLKIRAFQKGLAAARGQYYPTLSFYANVNTTYSNAATTEIPGSMVNVTTADFVTVGGTNYNVISPQQNFKTEYLSFQDQFRDNRYTAIGLSLTVPILNYLRARNNVKQAKINLQNAEYNANSTRLVLQQGVELAFQNMLAAYKQYKFYQEQVTAYAESFRTTEIRFNEGVINSDTYVIAKNNIDRANINLAQAKYIYILRSKILDYYQGRLSL
jgi:outer membrane protein